MDIIKTRDEILIATLPHVDFDGWTLNALKAGVKDCGYGEDMVLRAFPGSLRDLACHWADYADRKMVEELERRGLDDMRIRDKIATCVRVRLELLIPYREALRRVVSFTALPTNTDIATKCTYNTVSLMWYAVGDTSADFNFYTKRAMLMPVYTTTLLCWLQDESDNFEDTWAFLDRRIENVMQFQKFKGQWINNWQGKLKGKFKGRGNGIASGDLKSLFNRIPHPFKAIREGIREAGVWRPRR